MWQMVLTHVSIQGWIIHPYVQGLFYESSEVLVLSPQDGKIVNSDRVTRGVNMVMYRGRGLKMFFKPLFKISLLTLLYIHDHNPPCHIYICI